jgi:HK97 family phage major capsid protein
MSLRHYTLAKELRRNKFIMSKPIAELRSERAMLNIEARKITSKPSMTSTDREKLDKIVADAHDLTEQIDTLEIRAARPLRSAVNTNDETKDAATRSFERYIRTGRVDDSLRFTNANGEQRGLGSGTGGAVTGGSVFVPTSVGDLTIVQKGFGSLASAVRQMVSDSGNPIVLPITDDTATSDLTEISELVDASEVDPAAVSVTSTVQNLTSNAVVVSNQLLQDAAFSVEDMITDIFNTRVLNGLSKRIYLGNGGSFSAITSGVPATVTTSSPTAIAWSELTSLFGSLNIALRPKASFVLSSLTHAYLMGITNPSTGQPILQPDVHGNPFMSLLGRPLVIADQAATAGVASAVPILFGDLSSYFLRTARNASIIRLNEKYATQDAVGFILFVRAGGVSTSQSTVPSIVSLKMHA